MEAPFVVCQACGNLYMLIGTRHFCPGCGGEPASLDGMLAVVRPEPEAPPEVEESEEDLPPGGEEPAKEDPGDKTPPGKVEEEDTEDQAEEVEGQG